MSSALKDHFRRSTCRLCASPKLEQVISLAPTPPANEFIPKAKLNETQKTYPLDVFFCQQCFHLQLLDVVDPSILFRNYVYVSGTSPVFVQHFKEYAAQVSERYHLSSGAFVLEMGSNDGTLLRFFKERGMKVLGVDPAEAIAAAATQSGIPTLATFFNSKTAFQIQTEHGKADVIIGNNVFAHIDDLNDTTLAVKSVLSERGVFVFEVSYLVDVFEKTLFDTIYHEHLCYHSVKPLQTFFERHGMQLIDAQRVSSHGGSLRCAVQLSKGPFSVQKTVQEAIAYEDKLGLYQAATFREFSKHIDQVKSELNALLRELKSKGKKIAAFGAPAKATTLMYHFGIGREFIEFIVDDSPLKQNLYSPGLHIPVVPSEEIYLSKPDFLVILAWNFADSIVSKHRKFTEAGGKFIVPLPKVRMI